MVTGGGAGVGHAEQTRGGVAAMTGISVA